jgi:hypothetical protein
MPECGISASVIHELKKAEEEYRMVWHASSHNHFREKKGSKDRFFHPAFLSHPSKPLPFDGKGLWYGGLVF